MSDAFATHDVFNQTPPLGDVDLFAADEALRSAMAREAPGADLAELHQFARMAGSESAAEWARLANQHTPVLQTHDAQGFRSDRVTFHPAYHDLMRTSMAHGVHVREAGSHGHTVRAAKLYMAAQMEAGHCCPLTMTNAALPVLAREPSLALWREKAASRSYDASFRALPLKSSVTIGMGMTEKQGGSDVRANTTRAEPEGARGSGNAYRLTGHKWFMSAPMCDAFLVLAQAQGGLTCFLMPRFRDDGSVNAIHFQRLKDKLGNRSNASSEVEFNAAQARAIGEEGEGTRVIIEMVTLTRLDCAVSSAALMRQSLMHAVHHAQHRTAFQRKLIDQPLMACVLADLVLDAEAAVALVFRLARAFDTPDEPVSNAWRRIMTPIVKYWVCKTAPAFVVEAMECLGGNGYVETGLLARIYREVPVNAIWEGSGNIMALDVVRALQREPEQMRLLLDDLTPGVGEPAVSAIAADVRTLLAGRDIEVHARMLCEKMALLAAARLLLDGRPRVIGEGFVSARLVQGRCHTWGAHEIANAAEILKRVLPPSVA